VGVWGSDPQYSHGFLVPAFSAYLLWSRRGRLQTCRWGTSWWGAGLLAVAGLLRVAGGYLNFDWLEGMSLLPCLAGLAVLLGGWPALSWSWPAVAFLAFMIPLPYRVAHALSAPLQGITTSLSGYALQTLGIPCLVEGNTILMENTRLSVVEACSGLSMLIVFAALATAAAVVVRRPLLDRLVLLASAAPIAVAANAVRITTTGVAFATAGPQLGELIFHDLAGWLMMPLAIGLLALELKVLDWVLVSAPDNKPAAPPIPGVSGGKATPAPAQGRRRSEGSRAAGPPGSVTVPANSPPNP
jgi:exosortase